MPFSSLALLNLSSFHFQLSFTALWRISITITIIALFLWVHRWIPKFIDTRIVRQQRKTIEALATAVNAKDKLTFDHVRRVQIYAVGLGRLAGCSEMELQALQEGAILHDVGKIGVPDAVITKRGKLTAAEFEEMKMHPVLGAEILGRLELPFPIVPLVRHHHERWDGTGYPDGLKGEEIPLIARILSVADSFDAVREDRPYRKGVTRQESIDHLMERSGSVYDPTIVGLFVTNLPRFEAQIRAEHAHQAADFGVRQPSGLSAAGQRARPDAGLAV